MAGYKIVSIDKGSDKKKANGRLTPFWTPFFFLSVHVTNPVTFSPVAPFSHGGETFYIVIYKLVDALKRV